MEWQRLTAILIFIVAAASDGVDGYIARHFNQRSKLGEILDPIADKGLLLAGIITLSVSNWNYEFPLWFPVLVIARDAIVVVGAVTLHLLNNEVRVRPSWTGKTATVMQMIALSLVMLQFNMPLWSSSVAKWQTSIEFLDVPVYLAGIFTAISGAGYIFDGIRQLHASGYGEPNSNTPSK